MATRRTTRATRSNDSQSDILVKVGRIAGSVLEYALNGDRTVAAALRIADINVSGDMRIRVNSRVATLETTLRNGDVVTVAEKVQGGTTE